MASNQEKKGGRRETPYQSLLKEGMKHEDVQRKLGIEPALPPIARLKTPGPTTKKPGSR